MSDTSANSTAAKERLQPVTTDSARNAIGTADTHRLQMHPKLEEHYNLSDDLPTIIADAEKIENPLLTSSEMEELSTENSRLADDTTNFLPESPWYEVSVMVVFVGALVGVLSLPW